MRETKGERRTSAPYRARKGKCRTAGCDRMDAIMGRCTSHTPGKGNGWIKCKLCGKPLAEHTLMKGCEAAV